MKTPEELDRSGDFLGKVAPRWFLQGAWLCEAWKRFGGQFAATAQTFASEFSTLRKGETPESYASLTWAPSRDLEGLTLEEYLWSTPPNARLDHYRELKTIFAGQTKTAWLQYGNFRYIAETTVLAALLCGELRAYGSPHHTAAEPEWIPVMSWPDLQRDRGKKNVVMAEGIRYFHVHVINPFSALLQTLGAILVEDDKIPESFAPTIVGKPEAIVSSSPKRGPKALIFDRVCTLMNAQIVSGEITMVDLESMLEKNLAACYGASRDVVRKARNFVRNKTLINSDK